MYFVSDPNQLSTLEYKDPQNNTRGTPTNLPNQNQITTTAPFLLETDYLLTQNHIKYSVFFILRSASNKKTLFVNVTAFNGNLTETLFTLIIQNRTVLFQTSDSIFGMFELSHFSSWQKLLITFSDHEISVTQNCAEFSYLYLPSISKLEEWEKIAVEVKPESDTDIQVRTFIASCNHRSLKYVSTDC